MNRKHEVIMGEILNIYLYIMDLYDMLTLHYFTPPPFPLRISYSNPLCRVRFIGIFVSSDFRWPISLKGPGIQNS